MLFELAPKYVNQLDCVDLANYCCCKTGGRGLFLGGAELIGPQSSSSNALLSLNRVNPDIDQC